MGFYLDNCNKSMKYKYLDSLSEDSYKKKLKIRITLK